jgi:hypothetical protein
MKVGSLVRNKNSESGELGIFMGQKRFVTAKGNGPDYVCAEVFWPERLGKYQVGTIQENLIEIVNEI